MMLICLLIIHSSSEYTVFQVPHELLDMYNEWDLPSGKTTRGTDDNMTG